MAGGTIHLFSHVTLPGPWASPDSSSGPEETLALPATVQDPRPCIHLFLGAPQHLSLTATGLKAIEEYYQLETQKILNIGVRRFSLSRSWVMTRTILIL